MSSEQSEVDEISTEFRKLGQSLMQIIKTWRTLNPTATRVPRSVRREINQVMRADAEARDLAHAQELAHLDRAIREHRHDLVRDTNIQARDTHDGWFDRQRGLAEGRDRIENSIYAARHLTATERGQAATALFTVEQDPTRPITRVFRPHIHGLDALRARARDGLTRLRMGWVTRDDMHRLEHWHARRHERGDRPEQHWVPTARQVAAAFEQQHSVTDHPDDPRDAKIAELNENLDMVLGENARLRDELAAGRVPDVDRDIDRSTTGTTGPAATKGYEVSIEVMNSDGYQRSWGVDAKTRAAAYEQAARHLAELDVPESHSVSVEVWEAGGNGPDDYPINHAHGPIGMVTDEVTTWRDEHSRAQLADIEQLRDDLTAARNEIDQLRTDNTNLTRQVTELGQDRIHKDGIAAAVAHTLNPRISRPIFADGPVLQHHLGNGLDR
ncbi:MAG: hypothetical protein HOQ24_12155 [Mycobacteriaceae bacterium]|nr:hypothetical protein [Mycobacteriaceae bacterium]